MDNMGHVWVNQIRLTHNNACNLLFFFSLFFFPLYSLSAGDCCQLFQLLLRTQTLLLPKLLNLLMSYEISTFQPDVEVNKPYSFWYGNQNIDGQISISWTNEYFMTCRFIRPWSPYLCGKAEMIMKRVRIAVARSFRNFNFRNFGKLSYKDLSKHALILKSRHILIACKLRIKIDCQ